MKKLSLLFIFGLGLLLTSCGNGDAVNGVNDSTAKDTLAMAHVCDDKCGPDCMEKCKMECQKVCAGKCDKATCDKPCCKKMCCSKTEGDSTKCCATNKCQKDSTTSGHACDAACDGGE